VFLNAAKAIKDKKDVSTDNGFKPQAWNIISNICNKSGLLDSLGTPVIFEKSVLQSKWSVMKGEFTVFRQLKDQSGFGWEESMKRVTASEAVWDAYIESHPKAKKFRKQGFKFFSICDDLFTGQVATGQYAQSSVSIAPTMSAAPRKRRLFYDDDDNEVDDELDDDSAEVVVATSSTNPLPRTPVHKAALTLSPGKKARGGLHGSSRRPLPKSPRRGDKQGNEIKVILEKLLAKCTGVPELVTNAWTLLDKFKMASKSDTYVEGSGLFYHTDIPMYKMHLSKPENHTLAGLFASVSDDDRLVMIQTFISGRD
jgi:hypothetical protein